MSNSGRSWKQRGTVLVIVAWREPISVLATSAHCRWISALLETRERRGDVERCAAPRPDQRRARQPGILAPERSALEPSFSTQDT
jgi:hypothetical protein